MSKMKELLEKARSGSHERFNLGKELYNEISSGTYGIPDYNNNEEEFSIEFKISRDYGSLDYRVFSALDNAEKIKEGFDDNDDGIEIVTFEKFKDSIFENDHLKIIFKENK